VKTIKGYLNIL